MSLHISVILCTYNPRSDYLALALRAIGSQTMAYDRFELIVVDNNSNPALQAEVLGRIAGRPLQLVRETQQGLTHARVAGLKHASAPLIIFVDDDNQLDSDYLQYAYDIAKRHSNLGAYGGISEGVLEKPVGRLKQGLLPQLGIRNYGDERIEGEGSSWGKWEPIGAGLVVRKSIGEAFVNFVDNNTDASNLGRKDSQLMSGEDSLFSRLADELGFKCAYEPSLKLKHYMSAGRLKMGYLTRLIYNQGRSFVVLARLTNQTPQQPPTSKLKLLLGNFRHRCRTESVATAAIMIFWDSGFHDEMTG